MPYLWQLATNSRARSRPASGEYLIECSYTKPVSGREAFVGHKQKPQACRTTNTAYLAPNWEMERTHESVSILSGWNSDALWQPLLLMGRKWPMAAHLVVGPTELDGCRNDDAAVPARGREHCSEEDGQHCPARYVCSVAEGRGVR